MNYFTGSLDDALAGSLVHDINDSRDICEEEEEDEDRAVHEEEVSNFVQQYLFVDFSNW